MSVDLFCHQNILCYAAFFFAGIIDSICGGGGLVTIPVMIIAGIPTRFITGTNQCSSWVGTCVAAYKYLKSGNLHLKSALFSLPFAITGAFVGARINLVLPENYLKVVMIVLVPLILVFILFNNSVGENDEIETLSTATVMINSAIVGAVVGCYQGFYGPGAGLFFMIGYASLLKLNLLRSTGNTKLVASIAFSTSVLSYALSGAIIWSVAIPATVFNVIGSYLGASIAIKEGNRVIRPVLIVVVIALLLKIVSTYV